MTADPIARALGATEARWRCPLSWTRQPSTGPVPTLLRGQPRLRDGLEVLADLAGGTLPHHLELTVPPRVGWGSAVGGFLRQCSPGGPVLVADRPTARALRGEDARGLIELADGGILVVEAADLADDDGAWKALREAIALQNVTRVPPEGEEPGNPHPSRVSVVLIGTEPELKKLRESDPRVERLLRRRLDAADDVPRTRAGIGVIGGLLREHLDAHELGEASDAALSWLIETSTVGARRGRAPLDMRLLCQALSEARRARPEGKLDRRDVRRAWAARRDRLSTREENHRARGESGQLLIRTTGALVGVANGLMVYGQSRQAYSMPGRISARVAVGREGLINVERESKYSGRSFDKGVYQLAGLLRALFAQKSPLGVAATLTFEQSYGRVDGDSATLAEALALFSCLSRIPCRQDIAVSGAINPRGEILPVGSSSLKVEGWFETCLRGGLTGQQGALIPARSVADLQLNERVLRAMRQGRFSVWAATTIEEAIGLLLGRSAGLRDDGSFEPDSVYGRAGARLKVMSERLYPPRKVVGRKSKSAANQEAAAAAQDGAPEPPEAPQ